ncbi:MAG TPA: peptide ABC transporter substrate-binding protein [Candidatus Eremiobacteraceae bacterium]
MSPMPRALALAAFMILATGCAKVSTQTGTPSDTAAGVLRISDISDPSTLNPMLSGADFVYQLAGYTLEFLVQLDDKGNVIPVLCERVPSLTNGDISADGLIVKYHLRKGVTWSDGAPFTSKDIEASWRQVTNLANNVQEREGYTVVASIDTSDPHTAVVHLLHPYAPFVTRFFAAIQEGPIAVMPAHVIANLRELNDAPFSSRPIGTGPFIVQSWVRGGAVTFVANPHYWRGPVGLRTIVFQSRPSSENELVGFLAREIDADFDAGPQRLLQFRTVAGLHPIRSQSLRLSVLDMNTSRAPLNDVRVRRAVAFAVDRGRLLRDVFHGAGVLADEWIPNWSWAYTPDVPRYPHDPARSNALLDQAGWRRSADGFRYKGAQRLTVVYVGTAGDGATQQVAALVQSDLRVVGADLVMKYYPYDQIFNLTGPIRNANFDLAGYSFSVNYDPGALNDDGCDYFSPRGANDARYCDQHLDRLEEEGLFTNDRAERKKIYAEVQRIRMEAVAGLPLFFRDRVGMVTNDLRGYTPSRGIIPEWNAWQWTVK